MKKERSVTLGLSLTVNVDPPDPELAQRIKDKLTEAIALFGEAYRMSQGFAQEKQAHRQRAKRSEAAS